MKLPGCEEWWRLDWVDDHPTIHEAVVGSDGDTYLWPHCIIPGCANRACLRLNSKRCYPHTLPGVPIEQEIEEYAHS